MGWNEGGSVQIMINCIRTSKLLKRLLCGKAMNYMKYRTISHTVTVQTILTTTKFIKVSCLFISLQV